MYSEPAMAGEGTVYGGTIYDGPAAVPAPTFSTTVAAAQGSFEVGKVLGEAFRIYFRNFVPFLLLSALSLFPMLLAMVLFIVGATRINPEVAIALLLVLVFGALCGFQLATASITYGVFQQMRGRDVSIPDCLGRGLSSLLPVLGLVIIQTAGVMAGLIACIVPGILLALRWSVSVPTAVEERQGAFEALRRSTYLTDGFRGTIFGVLFVLNIANSGVQQILGTALKGDPSSLLIALGAVIVLGTGLQATATAVMYYRLRSIKESIDVDQIASVFA
jgi:hypothetical protein